MNKQINFMEKSHMKKRNQTNTKTYNNLSMDTFEKAFMQISFELMKEKMFIPVGLEMSATNIVFEEEEEFMLKEMTFAYFSPLDNSIHINIAHPFFNAVPEELNGRLFFILFHEINHKLLLHHDRMKNRVPNLWNIAGDYEIHNMLYIYNDIVKSGKMMSPFLKNIFEVVEKILKNSDGANFKHVNL